MDVFDVFVDYVADHDYSAVPDVAHVRVAADSYLDASLVAMQMVAAVGLYPVAANPD